MEIFVTSRRLIKSQMVTFQPTGIIAISDPEHNHLDLDLAGASFLPLKFHDICFELVSEGDKARYSPPTRDIVRSILAWGKSDISDDSRIMVHCFAGISRSSAAAIITMIPLLGPEEAVKRVMNFEVYQTAGVFEPGYSWFMPNNLMIQYADEELGLFGQLVRLTESNFNY